MRSICIGSKKKELMLTKIEVTCLKQFVCLPRAEPTFFHQLESMIFSLLHSHQRVHVALDNILKLPWQTRQDLIHSFLSLSAPVLSLRGNIGRGDDPSMRIHQEESKDLAVARLGRISQRTWRNPVLDGVWEREESALFANHSSDILCDMTVASAINILWEAIDILQKLVFSLLISNL